MDFLLNVFVLSSGVDHLTPREPIFFPKEIVQQIMENNYFVQPLWIVHLNDKNTFV